MADSPHPERSRRIRPRPVARAASTTGLADAGFIVPPVDEKPHYLGHRQRLRERLLNAGAAALPDYELLEFLLTAALPRGDVKPLAKKLIDHFHGFAGVLAADRQALLAMPGMGDAAIAALMAVREAGLRLARTELRDRPVLGSWQKVIDYCTAHIGFAAVEEFHLLFLDRKNALIADERQQRGTVDHTPVYPREVVKRAIELGASALIMAHNHPSGDPTPSKADIETTREVAKAAALLGVTLHDHIIIGRGRHASLKSLGLF
jgi:DNA repair protein RadC